MSDHCPIVGNMNYRTPCLKKHRIMETRSWNDNIINAFVSELQQPPRSVIDSFTDVNDLFCSGVAV